MSLSYTVTAVASYELEGLMTFSLDRFVSGCMLPPKIFRLRNVDSR